jgi:hypothetical protein
MTQTDVMTLACTACGASFDAARLMPLMRCPECGALGYPDRAGQYLTTLSWTCVACGTVNEGWHNFCLGCGAGLASRCLRCDAPVYGVFCSNCGAHQARAWRFEAEQRSRQDGSEPRPLTPQERAAHPAPAGKLSWQELDRRWRRAAHRRARQWRGQQRGWLLWLALLVMMAVVWNLGGLWPTVLWGAGALLWGALPGRWRRLMAALLMASAAVWVGSLYLESAEEAIRLIVADVRTLAAQFESEAWPSIREWWERFLKSLPRLTRLTQDDPAYAILFGTIAFGLAILPAAIYLIERVVRRLFRD